MISHSKLNKLLYKMVLEHFLKIKIHSQVVMVHKSFFIVATTSLTNVCLGYNSCDVVILSYLGIIKEEICIIMNFWIRKLYFRSILSRKYKFLMKILK